jgi:hypothetical protein
VVGRYAIHVDGLFGDAAKEVATANDNADLAAGARRLGDFIGDCADEQSVDTEATASSQGFSGELEEDAFIHGHDQCTGCGRWSAERQILLRIEGI